MIVAIDGPAGSGKSTVARRVADHFGLDVLDTGAMYRAVTARALALGLAVDDEDAVGTLAETCTLEAGERVLIDDTDVTELIRDDAVTRGVSAVARQDRVRRALRARQRAWAHVHGGGVVEGRDIGTVVFADADVKVYLDADPSERARRRSAEQSVDDATDEVARAIQARDTADSSQGRATSPGHAAPDAQVIDTTRRTIDDVVQQIVELVRERTP